MIERTYKVGQNEHGDPTILINRDLLSDEAHSCLAKTCGKATFTGEVITIECLLPGSLVAAKRILAGFLYEEAKPSTRWLYEMTYLALSEGRWLKAFNLLDNLSLREDNKHKFPSAESYGFLEPSMYYDIIQNRIDLVNSKVKE